ncbi:MAG: diguanylate cyclase [Oscillospiraceae bacterium]|nr:diguanylate cyclase [Oscillospiraceae bacterium]MCL2280114.1 diguanylate cyclase [Oscillospiraceae bacterium]
MRNKKALRVSHKLTLGMLLIMAVGLIVAFSVINTVVRSNVYDSVLESTLRDRTNHAQELDAWFAEHTHMVETLSSVLPFTDRQHYQYIVEVLVESNEVAQSFWIALADGTFYDSARWVPPYWFVSQERPWWILSESRSGEVTITLPYISAETGILVSTISRHIQDWGNQEGVVAMNIDLLRLEAMMIEYQRHAEGYLLLTGPGGEFIIHPHQEYLPSPDGLRYMSEMLRYAEVYAGFQLGESVVEYVDQHGVPSYFMQFELPSTGWTLVAVVPTTVTSVPVQHILTTVITSIVLVLAMVMVFSFVFLSQRFVRPIEKLKTSISEAALGNLDIDIDKLSICDFGTERTDEVGDLYRAIGNMLREIDSSHEKEREADKLNQVLVDSAPYVIALWDKSSHNPIAVSHQAREFFGIDDTRLIVDNLFAISPEFQPCGTPTSEKAIEVVSKAYDLGYHRFEWLHRKQDGTLMPSECFFKHFIRNGEDMLVSYTRDLTEVKEAEEKVEHRERLLRTINKAAMTLLAVEDKEKIVSSLAQTLEMIGKCLDLDRVHLSNCDFGSDEVLFTLISSWYSEVGRSSPILDLSEKLSLNAIHEFKEMFFSGGCFNGPIVNLPMELQQFLNPFGSIKSIIIIPLILNGEAWGVLTSDDCVNERSLSEEEMDILRSAASMFVSVFSRFIQRDFAVTDALTGVHNRRYFTETAEHELQSCIETNRDFSIIMVDIDHFKSVNDRYGHTVGDEVLKIFAARIRHVLKHDTSLTRYGGEEFVVTLPGVNQDDAVKAAWRINKAIEKSPFLIEGLEIKITASLGVASFGVTSREAGCKTLSEILISADKVLYQAKDAGRNTVIGFNGECALGLN